MDTPKRLITITDAPSDSWYHSPRTSEEVIKQEVRIIDALMQAKEDRDVEAGNINKDI